MARTSTVTTQTTIASAWANALITDYVSQTDTTDQDLASDIEIVTGKELRTNTISETSSATGVTVDGCLVKDGAVALASGIAGKAINTAARADDTILVFSAAEDEYLHEGFPISGIADQVWDEPSADHVAGGSFGALIQAADGGNLTHDLTTANDKAETEVTELSKTGIYQLSVYFDLDSLVTADEGGTVTFRLYGKIDGTNYSDIPSVVTEFVVGIDNEYPSIEINLLHGYSKITVQCSEDVSATRTFAYRTIVKDLGA